MQKQKRKQTSAGLYKRNGTWHIDKVINGDRVCQSCETSQRGEAEQVLARLIEQRRLAKLYGVRPDRTFAEAATKFVEEFSHKKSIQSDINDLKRLMPYIGELYLKDIHNGTIETYIKARRKDGVKSGTINRSIRTANRILKLCANNWRDKGGLTWLERFSPMDQVQWKDKRKPRPITWAEQFKFFNCLPQHLREACDYAVQTGCREQEICQLEWEWEIPVPELDTSVFLLPDWINKNGVERIVILNETAKAIVDRQRGKHPTRVFSYEGQPLAGLNGTSFQKQRARVGLQDVRFHDLRHTFGNRLRSAGVNNETRSDLLGHDNGSITSHYSLAEIQELYDAIQKIAKPMIESPTVTFLQQKSRNIPAREIKKA